MKWKPFLGWTLAGIAALILIAVVGGLIFLRSSYFQSYVLRKVSQEAQASTGAATQIQKADFSLSPLTARLYAITIHGTEGPNQPPLLRIDKLTVGVKIQSLVHKQFTLREILIEHPVVHVSTNRAGETNLPQPPPSQSQSQTSIFDLAIGHLQLTSGELNYNDAKVPLDADLYDLGTDIHFDAWRKKYSGSLGYKNGSVRYQNYPSLPHKLTVKFDATPERFTLESAQLNLGASEAVLHASISGYSNPVADGDYEIRIHAQDFATVAPSFKPAGDALLAGKLHYKPSGNEPLVRAVSTQGRLASKMLSAAASGTVVSIRNAQGRFELAGGTLRVSGFSLETLGGSITSDAEITHLDTTPNAHVRAALHAISLRAAQQTLHQPDLKDASVSGTLNGTAEAAWNGSLSNTRARADLMVRGAAANAANRSASDIPVDGAIHAVYDGSHGTLTLNDTSVRIPSATLTAQGTVSDRSNLQIALSARDLHQLLVFGNSFRASGSAPPAISGSASLNAVVRGSMRLPSVSGHLGAQNLEVQGSQWSSLNLDVQANPSRLQVKNGTLVSAKKGQASFAADVQLRNWAYQSSAPIHASLSVRQMPIDDMQRLADQHYPVSGDLSANLNFLGSQLDPKGSGSAQVVNARAYDEPIQTLAVKFEAASGSVVSTINVATQAGGLTADFSFTPKTKAYKVKLDAPGVVLEKLKTLQARNLPVTGTITATANGEGTLDNPQLSAVVQASQLNMEQHSLGDLKAEVRIAEHHADLNLNSSVENVALRGRAHVNLTGGYDTDAAIDTTLIPLGLLITAAAQSVPEGFQGQTELHATLKGPLKDQSKIEAHVSIPTLAASYQSLQIGLAAPLRADYSNSVVTLQPVEIRGTGTSLHLQGSIPVGGSGVPNLVAKGSIDVRVLRIVAPDAQTSGLLAIDLRTSGTAKKPELQGQVHIQDVAMATAEAPIGIEKLNGTLDVSSDRVQISNLDGEMGGGKISVGGAIAYRPSLQFNVALKGQSVRLRYPEGLRTLLDANLAFSGTPQASALNGRVLMDNLNFSQDFDLAKFSDQFSTGTTTPSQPGFADNVKLGINVQSKESLSATSSQVSIAGRVNLQVVGTAADPVITGRTNLTSGELFYRGVRYELQRGVITFDDPNQTHPVMNVSVTTKVEQYNLTVTMRGPLDKLTTSYASDPPLASADVINLIARGKTTRESSASSQSTDSMIASGAAGQLSSSVQKLAGISSLQIDPLIGGNNQNPSARVAIQQRVTKNLFFTFSTDVSQPGSEIFEGEYQINNRWSASVTRDQLGGVAVDGKYHKRF